MILCCKWEKILANLASTYHKYLLFEIVLPISIQPCLWWKLGSVGQLTHRFPTNIPVFTCGLLGLVLTLTSNNQLSHHYLSGLKNPGAKHICMSQHVLVKVYACLTRMWQMVPMKLIWSRISSLNDETFCWCSGQFDSIYWLEYLSKQLDRVMGSFAISHICHQFC